MAAAAFVLGAAGCGADAAPAVASPVGTWGAEAKGQPSLTLAEDGKLSGTDGCNRLTGGWKQDGDAVKFTLGGMTMMMCEGVDTWLKEAASASVNSTVMTVRDAAGATIGTLEQAKE